MPVPPQVCPVINTSRLEPTPIPEPVNAVTARDAGDYILQLHEAIAQCNLDKLSVEQSNE